VVIAHELLDEVPSERELRGQVCREVELLPLPVLVEPVAPIVPTQIAKEPEKSVGQMSHKETISQVYDIIAILRLILGDGEIATENR
jgi:hypothetical protein